MELLDPNPIKDINFENKNYQSKRNTILFNFAFSLVIVLIFEFFVVFNLFHYSNIIDILMINAAAVIYVFISRLITIKPDYNNLGWVPFLVDNPFKISDNGNRILVFFNVFFSPGRYISKSILDFWRYRTNKLF
jgi:hypothetical protein